MDSAYRNAFIHGYERMAAWSDVLDEINVFPVADSDTGRNLKISLAPLRQLDDNPKALARNLIRAATGNSGNIAAAFFCELVSAGKTKNLPFAIQMGTQKAFKAVADPQPGTMLTVFEDLAHAMAPEGNAPSAWPLPAEIVGCLEKSVVATSETLPLLKRAGVVDAGALGMFIFLEAFFDSLLERTHHYRPVTEIFGEKLSISPGWNPGIDNNPFCINTLIRPSGSREDARQRLKECGESLIVTDDDDCLKVHLHTDNRGKLRSGLKGIGQVLSWSEAVNSHPGPAASRATAVHIMTDAAGSITVADAQNLGMTLLDSYLVLGDQAWPESLLTPEKLYAAMVAGTRVSTAQASVFERHQSCLSAISRFEKVLYLCVGSVYTGNFEVAMAWRTDNHRQDRLTVIDTGAASGRLGIIALATARFARQCKEPDTVLRFAREAVAHSQEFVFLDQLKFLAAGGRISKTKGFLGDLLHTKPIISPTAQGAAKVGVVRNRSEQLAFALERLEGSFEKGAAAFIMLQFSDNRSWVEEIAAEQIRSLLPAAEIILRPLSLTSGAHMGPGTWAVAFLPAAFNV